MRKSGLVVLISILFSSSVLAQSTPDWSLNAEMDTLRDIYFCKGTTSASGRNVGVIEKESGVQQLHFSIQDRVNGNKYTINDTSFTHQADNVIFEVSDFGPVGSSEVNVAYSPYVDPPVIHFSSDSGQSFTPLSLPHDGFYDYMTQESLTHLNSPNSVKFDPVNGYLYAMYFSSPSMGTGPVAVNLARWDRNGTLIDHQIVATNDDYATFGQDDHFIAMTVTDKHLVSVFKPGRKWQDENLLTHSFIPDSMVLDLSTHTITDQVHIGAYTGDSNDDYYNDPYRRTPIKGGGVSIITSDGSSVYLATQSGKEMNGEGQEVNVVEFRRFGEYSPDKFFPDDHGFDPLYPFTHLPSRATNARSIDFMTKSAGSGTLQGLFHGFAAARYDSNFTNEVSVMYLPASGTIDDHLKITFDPDSGTSGISGLVIEDVTTDSLTELFGAGFKSASTFGHRSGGLSSAYGGTISHFCTFIATPESGQSFWNKYWSAMS